MPNGWLLEWLRHMIGNELPVEAARRQQLQKKLDGDLNSTFARDTLFKLMGGPTPVRVGYPIMGFMGGVAETRKDGTVVVSPGMAKDAVTNGTLAHELVHVAHARGNGLPLDSVLNDSLFKAYSEEFPGTYAATRPREYRAEMFRSAMDMIRSAGDMTAVDRNLAYNDLMEYADANGPGTRETVAAILESPVYASTQLGVAHSMATGRRLPLSRQDMLDRLFAPVGSEKNPYKLPALQVLAPRRAVKR